MSEKNTEAVLAEADLKAAVDELERILRQQLACAQKGNAAELETLAEQAQPLAEKISKCKLYGSAQYANRRAEINKLYGQLCLVLSSEMKEVKHQLGRLYEGKRAVRSYSSNIGSK